VRGDRSAAHVRRVRAAAHAGLRTGPRLLAPAAARAAPRRRRLPGAPHDRRARAPSAREDRGEPARPDADPDRARSRATASASSRCGFSAR
jgi:hypothetical protein